MFLSIFVFSCERFLSLVGHILIQSWFVASTISSFVGFLFRLYTLIKGEDFKYGCRDDLHGFIIEMMVSVMGFGYNVTPFAR